MTEQVVPVGIIGEGKMGTNIFHYLIESGFHVTWIVSPEADIEKLRKNFQKKLNRSREAGIISPDQYATRISGTEISKDLSCLKRCLLVIEAVYEDLELKQKLFHDLDLIAQPETILASNSSSIRPSELFPSEKRKDKVIGIHFFYPVQFKNIIELIITPDTSEVTILKSRRFLMNIRREFIELEESQSFLLNRIFLEFQNEAFLIVNEGKSNYHHIDELVKKIFFPTGVFDFMDSVGISTMLTSVKNYARNRPDSQKYDPLIYCLQKLDGSGTFYTSCENPTAGYDESTEAMIAGRLRDSFLTAFNHFSASSNLSPEKIQNALREYFGAELNWLFP